MIRSIIVILYNIIRITIGRLCHGRRYAVHYLQRISPYCALKLFQHGRLVISRNCEFAHGCDIEVFDDATISIGEGTYMNRYCMVSAHSGVSIGKHCLFGAGVKVFDNNHVHTPEKGVSTQLTSAPVVIGDHCWLASGVVILKGVTIGDNCVVGAGCIIYHDLPAGSVVYNKQELVVR
ncbi:MAG: acyltransferase [Bacteroidaceae bacterium]|nr:acyltransferase [Bacteroidaceae bacterium]